MPFELTPDIAARIASRLPDGRSVDHLRIITAQGRVVSEVEDLSTTERALIASQLETAGGPPMLTNGAPTIMRIVAWLGHDGINANRLAFVADELGPAADRIREPNFLLMDFNHSAVLPFSFDQKVIGVWYKAEKRWDPKANDGAGAYGILAQGIMWAWAFPDYANNMLAEQERDGVLKFSMACLPETVEMARNDDGPFEIAHNPVFLTLSALDVPPADRDALGLGKEGSTDPNLENELTRKLVGQHALPHMHEPLAAAAREARADELTEDQMDELKQQIEALKAQLETANAKLEAMTTAEQQVVTLTAQIEELKGQLTEANTAKAAMEAQAETLRQAAETANTALTTAQAQLDAIAAKEADAAKTARYEARLAALPEAYRTAFDERADDEKARFAKKWTEASDEDWSDFQTEITRAFDKVKISYVDKSRREGGSLPLSGASPDDMAEAIASIKK